MFMVEHSDGLYHKFDIPNLVRNNLIHMERGLATIMVTYDRTNRIVGVATWNWRSTFDNWDTMQIIDLVIHPDFRYKRTLHGMLFNAYKHMPWIKFVSFGRKKYGDRMSSFPVNRLLKENKHVIRRR